MDMQDWIYSILIDYGSFEPYLVQALFANFPLFCVLLGVKIGLGFLRDVCN